MATHMALLMYTLWSVTQLLALATNHLNLYLNMNTDDGFLQKYACSLLISLEIQRPQTIACGIWTTLCWGDPTTPDHVK